MPASEADLRQRVSQLIARKTGLSVVEIRPASRLFHDLGVAGDDAGELITEFAKTFDVDMSGFTPHRPLTTAPADHAV